METTVIQTINSFGHLGIVILIAIENLFPPIPSEVILVDLQQLLQISQ